MKRFVDYEINSYYISYRINFFLNIDNFLLTMQFAVWKIWKISKQYGTIFSLHFFLYKIILLLLVHFIVTSKVYYLILNVHVKITDIWNYRTLKSGNVVVCIRKSFVDYRNIVGHPNVTKLVNLYQFEKN